MAACSSSVGDGIRHRYVAGTSGGGSTSSTGIAGEWNDETGAPLVAGLIAPWGLAFDNAAQYLFISDANVMRRVDFILGSPNNVETVAGGSAQAIPGMPGKNYPNNWFNPPPANLYLPSTGSTNNAGSLASFNSPSNIVVVSSSRRVYIADTGNNLIRSMTY